MDGRQATKIKDRFFFSKVIFKLTYTIVCQQPKQKKVKEVMEDYFYQVPELSPIDDKTESIIGRGKGVRIEGGIDVLEHVLLNNGPKSTNTQSNIESIGMKIITCSTFITILTEINFVLIVFVNSTYNRKSQILRYANTNKK